MTEIKQTVISFENEPEEKKFLTKEQVHAMGGVDLILLGIEKNKQVSERTQKEYVTYTLTAQSEATIYEIGYVFRADMTWGKVPNPKKIHVQVERQGKYLNWIISSRD